MGTKVNVAAKLFLLCSLLLIAGCGYQEESATPPFPQGVRGNTIGNLASGGLLVAAGEELFIAYQAMSNSSSPEDGIYRLQENAPPQLLHPLMHPGDAFLNYSNGWLFFIDNGLYALELATGEYQQLHASPGRKLVTLGNFAYYETSRGILRIALHTHRDELFLPDARLLNIYEDQLYYLEANSLRSKDLSTGQVQVLFEPFPETEQYQLGSRGVYYRTHMLYIFCFMQGEMEIVLYREPLSFHVDDINERIWYSESFGLPGAGRLMQTDLSGVLQRSIGADALRIFLADDRVFLLNSPLGFHHWSILHPEGTQERLDFPR